jgi:hypothetical protein
MDHKHDPSWRTDDVALRIEHALGLKLDTTQYKNLCGILRMYRHESMKKVLERAAEEAEDSGGDVSKAAPHG